MKRPQLTILFEALWELAYHDLVNSVFGFRGTWALLRRTPTRDDRAMHAGKDHICRAMDWAISLYFRPVLCLQRSVATARLLRRHGENATVVVGYCPVPFFSHAWVEIDDVVVNDMNAYRDRLNIMFRA